MKKYFVQMITLSSLIAVLASGCGKKDEEIYNDSSVSYTFENDDYSITITGKSDMDSLTVITDKDNHSVTITNKEDWNTKKESNSNSDTNPNTNTNTNTTSTKTDTTSTKTDTTNTPTNSSVQNSSVDAKEEVVSISSSEMNSIINDTVYSNLYIAREYFASLLAGGSVSSRMISMQDSLSSDECNFIDTKMVELYNTINDYVNAYELLDGYEDMDSLNTCYKAGKKLYDNYGEGLNRQFLYDVKIKRKIPKDFQDNILNPIDSYDSCFPLESNQFNSRKFIVRLGDNDDILCSDAKGMDAISEWYKNLASTILDEYAVFNSTEKPYFLNNNDDVCWVWNKSKTERIAYAELLSIIESNDFDTNYVRIGKNEDGNYWFVDNDNYYLEALNFDQVGKCLKVESVFDALACQQGNASLINSNIHYMISDLSHQDTHTYTYSK